ncbi:hypothetical protein [Curtobacterium sp. ZW137]|uniref:hypothetical protein n=1 Tax=Curtobacterium sp. ZW137 TaxID=2485104 RepID=UPI000F4CFC51|nr:hypothetical protein [Curtobacterium sp. ZW137]
MSVASRRSASGAELRDAGLTGRFGALTDDGARFVRLLDRPDVRFGASAAHHGKRAHWGMWLGGDSALVRAQGSVAGLVAGIGDLDVSRFDILPAGSAVGHLMAWSGLTPAWAFASDGPIVVPTSDIDRRIEGESVPKPPGADSLMERLWSAPTWTRVRVWSEATGRGTEWISAGADGTFRAVPVADGRSCRIEVVPGGAVFRDVLSVFLEAPPSDA